MKLIFGTLLKSRYEIKEHIGGGGFGSVYLALDTLKGNLRAIKETSYDSLCGEDLNKVKEQFRFEAEILVKLSHRQLPEVEDFFEEDNKSYLVMEYIEGEDLHEIMDKNSSIPQRQILDWAIQLCNVMEYLHDRKPEPVIFRDLKPKNIMLSREGEIKLIDFGISKLLDSKDKTRSAARAASQHYSSPEQYTSAGTDTASDIYSLGATLYFLFTCYNPVDAIDRITDTLTLLKPSSMNKTIPQELDRIIMKSLEIEKNKRYTSVIDVRKDLEKLLPSMGELPDTIELSGRLIDNTLREKKDNSAGGKIKYKSSTASREIAEKEFSFNFKFKLASISTIAVIIAIFLIRPVMADFTMKEASNCYRLNEYDIALKWMNWSSICGNSSPEFHFAMAQIYLGEKKYNESIGEFEKVLKRNPSSVEIHYWLGRAYFLSGNYEKSLKEFQIYQNKAPDDWRVFLELGNLYIKLDRIDNAFLNFFNCLEMIKNYDRMVKEYDKWQIKRKRSDYLSELYLGLGNAYLQEKDYLMSLRQYETVKKIDPENIKIKEQIEVIINKLSSDYRPETGLILGNAYLLLGDSKKALDEYSELIKNPKFKGDAYFLMHTGQAFQGTGDTKEAIRYFKSAFDEISKNPDKYSDLTLVTPADMVSVNDDISYENKNEISDKRDIPAGAMQKHQDSITEGLAPENYGAELYYYTGEAYLKEKDYKKAAENYDLYLKKCPSGVFKEKSEKKLIELKEVLK